MEGENLFSHEGLKSIPLMWLQERQHFTRRRRTVVKGSHSWLRNPTLLLSSVVPLARSLNFFSLISLSKKKIIGITLQPTQVVERDKMR